MEESVVPEPPPARIRLADRIGKDSAKKDKVEGQDLIGEIVALILMSFVLWFFVAHKLKDSGFYTDDFGALEMAALYSAGGFVVLLAFLRVLIRRRNLLRPLEIASYGMLSTAHAILLASFPFDFEHVGDVLPRALSWSVDWISDTAGAVILALGIPGGIIGAAITAVIYIRVKKELSAQTRMPSEASSTIEN